MRTVTSAAIVLFATSSAAISQTTCDILARNLRQDVLLQGNTVEQFAEQQSLICSQTDNSWSTAQGKSLNGSLSVPGYVDAVLGTSSTQQNWGQNLSRFCNLQAGSVASSQDASTVVRQASAAAYNAIVQCVRAFAENRGIFGELNVNDKRDGFTIRLHHKTEGSSDWNITGIVPTPRPSNFSCNENLEDASLASPRTIRQASFTVACEKDPHAAIQVAVNTSAGTLPTYQIASVDEELSRIKERLAIVESRTVPNGTVAWFARPRCPAGWADYAAARGRTIVGAGNTNNRDAQNAVISGWSVEATGGEESHTLTVNEMPGHAHVVPLYSATTYKMDPLQSSGLHPTPVPGMTVEHNVGTTASGGSQPHNNMPPFVALTPCIKQDLRPANVQAVDR